MSFHCPKCDGLTGVIETRTELRQRRCKSCNHTFLTKEVEYDGSIERPRRNRSYQRAYYQKNKHDLKFKNYLRLGDS